MERSGGFKTGPSFSAPSYKYSKTFSEEMEQVIDSHRVPGEIVLRITVKTEPNCFSLRLIHRRGLQGGCRSSGDGPKAATKELHIQCDRSRATERGLEVGKRTFN